MDQKLSEFYAGLEQRCCAEPEELENFLLGYEPLAQQEGGELAVAVYHELGALYRESRRYSRSILAYEAARDEIRATRGTECMEYASLLNNMAGTYRLAGKHDRAIALFREAIALYQKLGDESSYSYISLHTNLSQVYQETGQVDFAIYHLRKSLDALSCVPRSEWEMAVGYSNLTLLYHKAGRQKMALECLEEALDLFAECEAEENCCLAQGLRNLAGVLFGIKRYDQALEVYQRSADYTQRHFGRTAEYAAAYQCMSWVYREMGKPYQAIAALETAGEVCAEVFGPEHERTAIIQSEIGRLKKSCFF